MVVMLAFCCGGLAVVPVVWFLDHTDDQGDAPATAVEAVDEYLVHLSSGEEIGLRRSLAEDRYGELLFQWREIRREMDRTDPPVSRLDWSEFQHKVDEISVDTEKLQEMDVPDLSVSVPVSITRWGNGGMAYQGAEHPWSFDLRKEDGGWRIAVVRPHPWCGGHVRADACQ